MPLAPRVILHSPPSDEALLSAFVAQCLGDRVSLVAVVGPGCERIEDILDELVVGDASDVKRFFCTTSHPGEPFDEVLNFVQAWNDERGDAIEEVRL